MEIIRNWFPWVERRKSKHAAELEAALAQYRELREQANGMDADALDAARQSMRSEMEQEAYRQAREVYGKRYDSGLMKRSQKDVAATLGEQERQTSVREQIQQARQKSEQRARDTEQAKNRWYCPIFAWFQSSSSSFDIENSRTRAILNRISQKRPWSSLFFASVHGQILITKHVYMV